jgi:phospholipase/carboxylesterase
LAFSGFVPTVEGFSPDVGGRGDLSVAIHHGAGDPIISVEFARKARDLLREGGIEPAYLETDAGHWLPPEALEAAREIVSAL